MEVTGRIKVINPTQEVSASFKKRELVVTTDEQYPQHIMIEFTQAKVDDLNNFQVGEQVKVSINLRGREWTNPQGETKYFNSIQGWRIESLQSQQSANPQSQSAVDNYFQKQNGVPSASPAQAFEPSPNFNEEDHDDLPF